MTGKPLVIFDGRCGFCKAWIEYWKQLTGERVGYAPSQEVGEQFPQIPREDFSKSVQLVLPDGQAFRGADAVVRLLALSGNGVWLWFYRHLPGFAPVAELAYRFIAAHRDLFYWATRLTFGIPVRRCTYETVEWVFLRALGLIYLTAFASVGLQITGLVGSRGILPLGNYLQAVERAMGASRYWFMPSVFWLGHSDAALRGVSIAGIVISLILILGIFERIALFCLFALYLSITSAGQDFLSFQWDMLLVEAGFLGMFLGRSHLVVWLFRWLLFRLMFLSGSVKLLSHDTAWRDLSAMTFHFETQPLPTPVAWYVQQLPLGILRATTVFVFAVELAVPFLVFAPRRLRIAGAWCLLGFQTLIFITGNYAFFNLLTMALCLFLFDDAAFPKLRFRSRKAATPRFAAVAVAIVVLVLSGLYLSGTFFDYTPALGGSLLRYAAPFGIVNTYGLFAVMTTHRPEIVVQGSNDGVTWIDYEFRFKPGDLRKSPRWVAPYQPRLDWQMWFAALGSYRNSPWFVNFLVRLLQGSPQVLGLLASNPFPQAPPKYVRAELFEYQFTDFRTRSTTGNYWRREIRGWYVPAISLEDVREARERNGSSPLRSVVLASGHF
jgi:predicted DCC family thiol-disulfide oxidoreductase YuxK